jgi:hypothetical protein
MITAAQIGVMWPLSVNPTASKLYTSETARLLRSTPSARRAPCISSSTGPTPLRVANTCAACRLASAPPWTDADAGGGERPRVVDAVADHEHAALGALLLDPGELVFRAQLAALLFEQRCARLGLEPPGERIDHLLAIAREDDESMAERAQLEQRRQGVCAQRIAEPEQRAHTSPSTVTTTGVWAWHLGPRPLRGRS